LDAVNAVPSGAGHRFPINAEPLANRRLFSVRKVGLRRCITRRSSKVKEVVASIWVDGRPRMGFQSPVSEIVPAMAYSAFLPQNQFTFKIR